MFNEQFIEVELRGPGLPDCISTTITDQFHKKNKSLPEKPSNELLFTAKIWHETMHPTSPYQSQITDKI